MTKHWDRINCQGCEYLRAYGLPEDFIKQDHEQEVRDSLISDAAEAVERFADDELERYAEEMAERKMENC